MNQTKTDVLYLLSCAINGTKADKQKTDNIDLDALYKLCKEHNITALVADVICENIGDNPVAFSAWQQEKMKAIYRHMNFTGERAVILDFLERSGIWYLPMKGIILQDYYPKPELREFMDNDILVDPAYREEIKAFMLGRGYTYREDDDEKQEDAFNKEPCFNFEMHRSLYPENYPLLYAYYKDVKKKLIKDEDNAYGYHFSDEDYYLFMISHAYKHFLFAGFGIRTLLDIFVFLRAKADCLDKAYIGRELEKMQCADFEKETRELAYLAFGQATDGFSPEQSERLEYIFDVGTFGTPETRLAITMQQYTGEADFSKKGRLRYWFQRVFKLSTYREEFPRAYKTIIAIPFLMIYRCLRGLTKIKNLKKENSELKRMESIQKEKADAADE